MHESVVFSVWGVVRFALETTTQAPLGLVGAMALDPAVAAGVAVGCILFLIVVIFVFIKVSCASCSSCWQPHANTDCLVLQTCVFLCVVLLPLSTHTQV
jgi:hypothetical protein